MTIQTLPPSPSGLRWRGFLLDESRHFFGKATVLAYLDRMAALGFSVFHWHLTDDQGWRADLPGLPELAAAGAARPSSPVRGSDTGSDGVPYGPFFYTADELREVVAYADSRGILVVPEFDLPGHVRALLAAHPEFACEGAAPSRVPLCRYGICEDVLCVGNDEALAYCDRVLDALLEIFPSEFVHIGGDECPRTRWKACPKCQARLRAEGLPNEAALQSWATRRLIRRLAEKGRRAVVWDEALEGGELPADTVVQCWTGDAAAHAAEAARRGHDVVLSPFRETYFTIPEGRPGDPYPYREWVVRDGFVLPVERVRAFDPFAWVPPEFRDRVLGAECCAWSEEIADRAELDYKVLPRLAAFAEAFNRPAGHGGVWGGAPPQETPHSRMA